MTVSTTSTTPSTTASTVVRSADYERGRRRRMFRRAQVYAVAILLAIWVLIPIWLVADLALSTDRGVRAFPKQIFPQPISTETVSFFLNTPGIMRATGNSILVAVLTLILSTLIAVPAGYAISRYLFPGRDLIRLGILSVRAFPIVVLAVPLAVTFIQLGLFDQPISIALMHTALTLPTTILVVASVFSSVPVELEEAAQVFGCKPLQSFLRIVLPLTLPGIAAASMLTFVLSWNEVFAAIMLTTQNRTLPAEVLYTLDKSSDQFKFAGAFFMLIPALVFIFFIRRYLFNMWGQITK